MDTILCLSVCTEWVQLQKFIGILNQLFRF